MPQTKQSVLITGSAGLIGSEVCQAFDEREFSVHGVDNNQRREFFGPDGDTSWKGSLTRPRRHISMWRPDRDRVGAKLGAKPDERWRTETDVGGVKTLLDDRKRI